MYAPTDRPLAPTSAGPCKGNNSLLTVTGNNPLGYAIGDILIGEEIKPLSASMSDFMLIFDFEFDFTFTFEFDLTFFNF